MISRPGAGPRSRRRRPRRQRELGDRRVEDARRGRTSRTARASPRRRRPRPRRPRRRGSRARRARALRRAPRGSRAESTPPSSFGRPSGRMWLPGADDAPRPPPHVARAVRSARPSCAKPPVLHEDLFEHAVRLRLADNGRLVGLDLDRAARRASNASSPGCLSHARNVASSIESETFGMPIAAGRHAQSLNSADAAALGKRRRERRCARSPRARLASASRRSSTLLGGTPSSPRSSAAAHGQAGRARASGRARPRAGTCRVAARVADEAVGDSPRRTPARRRSARARQPELAAARDVPRRTSRRSVSAAHPQRLPRAARSAGRDGLDRRVLAVAVVLADEEDRQVLAPSRSSGTRRSSAWFVRRRRSTRPRSPPVPRSASAAPVAAAMEPPTIP